MTSSGIARCPPLTGMGGLPQAPTSMAEMPGGQLAIGGTDAIVLLDPQRDLVLWTLTIVTQGDSAQDVFPLQSAAGDIRVAATMHYQDYSVGYLYLIKDPNTVDMWKIGTADLPVGYAAAMQPSPFGPTHVLALDCTNARGGIDIDTTSSPRALGANYATCPNGIIGRFAYSRISGVNRFVWKSDSLTTTEPDKIFYVDDPVGMPTPMRGPVVCASCNRLGSVVPDPIRTGSFFAKCNDAANNKSIVRISDTSNCQTVATESDVEAWTVLGIAQGR